MLHECKIESGYGDSVVRRLSKDLKERYPKMGVSPRNLWDMKKFYERFCHSDIKVRQAILYPSRSSCYALQAVPRGPRDGEPVNMRRATGAHEAGNKCPN